MVHIRAGALLGLLAQETSTVSVRRGSSGTIDIRDQVVPVLALLQTSESHLCARDVLFRVLKVLKLPCHQYAILQNDAPLVSSPVYPLSSECPSACWRLCRKSLRPGRSCGQRDRVGWVQSCCPQLLLWCGIVRIESGRSQRLLNVSSTKEQERVHTLKRPAPFFASPGVKDCKPAFLFFSLASCHASDALW